MFQSNYVVDFVTVNGKILMNKAILTFPLGSLKDQLTQVRGDGGGGHLLTD